MPLDGFRYRPATPRDAHVTAEIVAAGFQTYRSFAAPGWRPRSSMQEEPEIHMRLSRGDVHARIAFSGEGLAAGFTGWMPAKPRGGRRGGAPPRAHLWTLFVAPPWWGTGLAVDLLAWSVNGMRDSGYHHAQLWTPRDHARARAFYEREGWRATDHVEYSPQLALDIIRYARPLV